MSIKSKVLSACAAVTLTAGLAAAGAAAAPATWAATPSCGPQCINWYNKQFGTLGDPIFVVDVFRQGLRVGQPLILWKETDTDPAEDFTISVQGFTSDFYAAGLVSSAVNLHYGAGIGTPGVAPAGNGFADDPAVELEYAPFGVESGLCEGVARTAFQNEGVTLQPCGVTSRTVWIADIGLHPDLGTISGDEDPIAFAQGFFPLINGSDTNFSHPFVLAYPKSGYPTDRPRPQLVTQNLTGFSNGLGQIVGQVNDNQLWSFTFGQLK